MQMQPEDFFENWLTVWIFTDAYQREAKMKRPSSAYLIAYLLFI